jgi:Protein of unknown function (DUF3631)
VPTDDEIKKRAAELDKSLARKRDPSSETPELTDQVVINLAGMPPLQYAQQLGRVAKQHKVPSRLLEKAVDVARIELETEHLLEPHWEVKPVDDPVDVAQLFADIEARILQHVVMPKDLAFVVALWIGQSWIHDHGTYSPILGVTSAERDCGKSTLMGIISFLARRALTTVGVSAAALYRSIEKWRLTFAIDEADEAFIDNPDLRQVVNSGWTRGQGVMRCDPDTHEPSKFSTFCPKAIALKGRKMPDTMLSRTIFIEMKRRLGSERVEHFRHLDDAGFARVRSQLARWAQDCGEVLGLARPAQPDGFINRTASNWELMFAIADSLDEETGQRARRVAQHIVGSVDMSSAGVELLQDIKTMFDGSTLDYLTTKVIIERLIADPEKPWPEWSRGKPINDKGLADLLGTYSIRSRTVGPSDARSKGYRKADFEDAWERYLTPQRETERKEEDDQTPNLPFTRSPHCNHSTFAENSLVHRPSCEREKNGHFYNEINAVNGRTAGMGSPSPSFSAVDCSSGEFPQCSQGFNDNKGGANARNAADGGQESFDQPGSPSEDRAATNGRAAPGKFLNADGKPTDDPEEGYCGRTARQRVEEARRKTTSAEGSGSV